MPGETQVPPNKEGDSLNYLKEINAFYDWLELNSLSTSSIVLWHALMHINNKAGWAKEFTVATSVLSVKTGLSDRTIRNARNELKQKGRIDWKSRSGNKSAIYTIIPLSEIVSGSTSGKSSDKGSKNPLSEINAGNLSGNTSGSVSGSTSGNVSTLNKLNKTKLNKNIAAEANSESDVQNFTGEDVPTTPPVEFQDDLSLFANQLCDIYSTITCRQITPGEDMNIFQFAQSLRECDRDTELIKKTMERAKQKWKPKYHGDQIRSFKYFIPAIKEALAAKEAKLNAGNKEHINQPIQQGEQNSNGGYQPNSGFRRFKVYDNQS